MTERLYRGSFYRLPLLMLVILGGVSCGPQIIKGQSPFVSISGMALVNDRLSATFDIRNQNDIPMTITMIDVTVTVNDVELARDNRPFDLVISANSAEEVSVEELPDSFMQSLLKSLDEGEIKSLPFDIKGRVNTVEDGYLHFDHKGYLYPVPGKPGHFRSAVTQARGLHRDDKF